MPPDAVTWKGAAKALADEMQRRDAELRKVLQEPKRWRSLPDFVEGAVKDPSGRIWFSTGMSPAYDADLFARSVERAAAGQTQLVHGGRVVFVDKAGRVWVTCGRKPGLLLCYDSRTKEWGEPRRAFGEENLPPGVREGDYDAGWFASAFEDSAGNLYFVSGASRPGRGMGVNRLSLDGKWTFQMLEPKEQSDTYLGREVTFHEQAGGVVIITRDSLHVERGAKGRLLYRFDGNKWRTIDPRVCKHHDLEWAVPMRNGSIVTGCVGGSGIWTYWPPDLLARQAEEVTKLVLQLDSADPQQRERASAAFVALGPQLLPAIQQHLKAQDTKPEVLPRLRSVAQTLGIINKPNHEQAALGGRFETGNVSLVSKPAADHVRFYVEDCKDRRTGKVVSRAFVTVGTDGTLEMSPIPMDQWDQAGLEGLPYSYFEDSAGGIWLPRGLRVDTRRSNRIFATAPQGFDPGDMLFDTGQGLLCFGVGKGRYIYDAMATDGKGDLPAQIMANQAIHLAEGQAWAVNLVHIPLTIERLDRPAQPVRLPFEQMDANAFGVFPLRGALLVQAYSESIAMGNRTMLWDGQTWSGPAPLMDLVKPRAEFFAKAAGDDFTVVGPEQRMRLAGDGSGALWVAEDLYELANGGAFPEGGAPAAGSLPNQQYVRRLQYYDGATWHDVWAELAQQDPDYTGRILRAADGGKSILIETPKHTIILASFDGQKVRATKLVGLPPEAGVLGGIWAEGPEGELWCQSVRPSIALHCYRNGALTIQAREGQLLLGDSKQRIWCVDSSGTKLEVKVGDAWVSARIAGLEDRVAAMAEAPDGRLWLLYSKGVSQIALQDNAGKPAIRELGRWKWDAEKNQIGPVFCDARGGLWLCGERARHTRYAMPANKPAPVPSKIAPAKGTGNSPARPAAR